MPTHTVHHHCTACMCYVSASIAVAGCNCTSSASVPNTAYWQALMPCVADSENQLVHACCSLLLFLFVYTFVTQAGGNIDRRRHGHHHTCSCAHLYISHHITFASLCDSTQDSKAIQGHSCIQVVDSTALEAYTASYSCKHSKQFLAMQC